MPDPAIEALRIYRDASLSPEEKKRRLEQTVAHAPAPQRSVLSFEDYDTLGVVAPVEQRAPNRAMAQSAEADVRGKPAFDASAYARWATERKNDQARAPSNSDRRRVERGEAAELAADPRAGSALGTAARRAAVGVADTALLPYRGARALSGGRLPELSAGEAYALAESLARDEPVAATRSRQSVQDRAHPDARNLGDATAQTVDPFMAAEAMKGGLRLRSLGARSAAPGPGDGLLRDARGGADGGFGFFDDALSGDPERIAKARPTTQTATLEELKELRARAAQREDFKEFDRLESEIAKASHAAKNPPMRLEPLSEPTRLPPVRTSGPLPSFDRRTTNAGRPAQPMSAGRPIPASTAPTRTLEQRAKRTYGKRGENGDDPRSNEQLAGARQFWAGNPEYVRQAERAAEFIERHPDAAVVTRATDGNYSMNAELRTHAERRKMALEREPEVPRKDPVFGDMTGGTSHVRLDDDTADRARRLNRVLGDAAKAGHAYTGPVVRGVRLPEAELGKWLEAGHVDQKSMWSGTANEAAAADFAGVPIKGFPSVELRLRGKSGVPIEGVSAFPHEHEVAFPPGRKWKITGQKKADDGRIILDLEEIDRIPDGIDAPHSALGQRSDRRAV